MAFFRLWIYDSAAAERFTGRRTAQDIVVAAHCDNRCAQFELQPARLAGIKALRAEQAYIGNGFRCSDKKLYFGMVMQRSCNIRQKTELHIQTLGGKVLAGMRHHLPAQDLFHVHAGEIDRQAASGDGRLHFLFMGLETPNACMQS